ncbi:MAG: HAMP domain-containing protein [Spirochaetales bacterium]|nr:HAMP domain-containing protein [Spirochaetales bacterium]
MNANIFTRNALRIRLLLIAVATTALLAIYKTALGKYLMGLNSATSALYDVTSKFSIAFFSLAGFTLFYFLCSGVQTFYNLARAGEPIPEGVLVRASRITTTVLNFTFWVNFSFYGVSSLLMYFLNYYGKVEFFLGLRFGIFNMVTNFSTAFVASLLQITFMDYALDPAKKLLKVHYLKPRDKDMRIRTRLLLFTAATIVYMACFIALPAFNKLDEERNLREGIRRALQSEESKADILKRYDADFKAVPIEEYTRYTTIITIGLFVIIMGSSFMIFLEFNRRLRDVSTNLNELTKGEGDLSRRLPITKYDEIGHLTHNFNRFMQFLSELFSRVKQTAFDVKKTTDQFTASLSNANAEIEAMMEETQAVHVTLEGQGAINARMARSLDTAFRSIEGVRERIGDQAAVIEQNSASIIQITENIHEVHENTERAMRLTGELEESSARGSDAVNDTVEAVSDIAAFSKDVKEAGEIISSIANQTNILAMNASIEAAHAGGFGRGFAVVADEIRKLAELASQSAGEILAVMRSMDEKLTRTVDLAAQSGGELEKILDGMKRSAEVVTQITHAMSEQSSGANEIQKSFQHLLQATEELTAFIATQARVSNDIKQETDKFVAHSQSITESIQRLLASDAKVKTEVARVLSLAAANSGLVGALYDRVMKFRIEDEIEEI